MLTEAQIRKALNNYIPQNPGRTTAVAVARAQATHSSGLELASFITEYLLMDPDQVAQIREKLNKPKLKKRHKSNRASICKDGQHLGYVRHGMTLYTQARALEYVGYPLEYTVHVV